MHEVVGDLWTWPAQLRCITTNGCVNNRGEAIMGRGCALEAKQRFPELPRRMGELLNLHGNRVMRLGHDLASFPTKHHWRDKSDLALIRQSAEQIAILADKFGYLHVLIPRPGCNNGRLTWEEVRPVIAPFLNHRFTIITNE
jgi:hypothetical protein